MVVEPEVKENIVPTRTSSMVLGTEPYGEDEGQLLSDDYGKFESLDKLREGYAHSESKLGQQANEIGSLRKQLEQYQEMVNAQLRNAPAPPTVSKSTFNDLDEEALVEMVTNRPKDFINQMTANISQQIMNQVSEKVNVTETKIRGQSTLEKKHPDYQTLVVNPDFQQWVTATIPYQMAILADRDTETLSTIINMYKNSKVPNPPEVKVDTKRAQGLPPGGGGGIENTQKPLFTRAELMVMMAQEPDKYKRMQPQIMNAYKEGRVK